MKDKLLDLVGLEGFITDGFNEIHEELGASEPFDFEFDPCAIEGQEGDCHKIRVTYMGKPVAQLAYMVNGNRYKVTESTLIK